APWETTNPEINPERVAQDNDPSVFHSFLIPNISFIDLDTVFPTYSAEFILEGFPLMMLLLIGDVLLEGINMARTDRERAIPTLPMKIRQFIRLDLHPL